MRMITEAERLMGVESRLKKIAAGGVLRQEWADAPYWKTLASQYGIRLASWYIPSTEIKYLNKALKAVGKDIAWLKDNSALSVKEFMRCYDVDDKVCTTPAWVIQGLILEMADTEKA